MMEGQLYGCGDINIFFFQYFVRHNMTSSGSLMRKYWKNKNISSQPHSQVRCHKIQRLYFAQLALERENINNEREEGDLSLLDD